MRRDSWKNIFRSVNLVDAVSFTEAEAILYDPDWQVKSEEIFQVPQFSKQVS